MRGQRHNPSGSEVVATGTAVALSYGRRTLDITLYLYAVEVVREWRFAKPCL